MSELNYRAKDLFTENATPPRTSWFTRSKKVPPLSTEEALSRGFPT